MTFVTFSKLLCGLIIGGLLLFLGSRAFGLELTGAGSSFAYPLYAKWAEVYKVETGNSLNYQSIGSGGGIKQIENKTVDFGATDMPLSDVELIKYGMFQFPTAIGGVVPIVNIPGIKSGDIILTGDLLAAIYLGQITKWNDSRIVNLNSHLKLPNLAISPVYRSDGSGTTFVFTEYLGKVSKDWKDQLGTNTLVEWPVGLGGKGNEGVASTVTKIVGSIGYVEFAYVQQNKLTYTRLRNKRFSIVSPELSTFEAAMKANTLSLTDTDDIYAWPITSQTFVVVYEHSPKTKNVIDFFRWALYNGKTIAKTLDYVPLTDDVVRQIEKLWKEKE